LAATPTVAEFRIPFDHFGSSRKAVIDRIRLCLKASRPYDGSTQILSIKDIRISEVFELAKDVFKAQKLLPEGLHARVSDLPLTDPRRIVWRLVMPMARIAWQLPRVGTGFETGLDYWPARVVSASEAAKFPTELLFLSLCYSSLFDVRQQRVLAKELTRRLPNDAYAWALAYHVHHIEGFYVPAGAKPSSRGELPIVTIPSDEDNANKFLAKAYSLMPDQPAIAYLYAGTFLLETDKALSIKIIKRYLAAYAKPVNVNAAKRLLKSLGGSP
jgi:hypothetical protein